MSRGERPWKGPALALPTPHPRARASPRLRPAALLTGTPAWRPRRGDAHVQGLLGLGGLLLGAVADHGVALRQVQVEGDERPVLQAQRPQGGAVDLGEEADGAVRSALRLLPPRSPRNTGVTARDTERGHDACSSRGLIHATS